MEMDDLPNENLKDEILPNLPLPKGGVIIPPFLKGDGGGFSTSNIRDIKPLTAD
jgi:hypothetical protein